MTLRELPFVFLGGGVGASLRFLISYSFSFVSIKSWLATLCSNLIGVLIFFLSVKLASYDQSLNNSFLRIGVLGSLTTFSTFSYEIVNHIRIGQYSTAGAILFLNIFFGIFIWIWILR